MTNPSDMSFEEAYLKLHRCWGVTMSDPSPVVITYRLGEEAISFEKASFVELLKRAQEEKIPLALTVVTRDGQATIDFKRNHPHEIGAEEANGIIQALQTGYLKAVFRPQAWQNDYAVELDGKTEFNAVTALAQSPNRSKNVIDFLQMPDYDFLADDLQERIDHGGPFEVDVDREEFSRFVAAFTGNLDVLVDETAYIEEDIALMFDRLETLFPKVMKPEEKPVRDLKAAFPIRNDRIVIDQGDDASKDLTLTGENRRTHVVVGNLSVTLNKTSEGLVLDVFGVGSESEGPLLTQAFTFNDIEADLMSELDVDYDECVTWLREEKGIDFEASTDYTQRAQWVGEYAAAMESQRNGPTMG